MLVLQAVQRRRSGGAAGQAASGGGAHGGLQNLLALPAGALTDATKYILLAKHKRAKRPAVVALTVAFKICSHCQQVRSDELVLRCNTYVLRRNKHVQWNAVALLIALLASGWLWRMQLCAHECGPRQQVTPTLGPRSYPCILVEL